MEGSRVRAGLMRLGSIKGSQAVERLVGIVLRFDALCRGLGADLQEFDINPIGFYADSTTFRALNAKIVLAKTREDFS